VFDGEGKAGRRRRRRKVCKVGLIYAGYFLDMYLFTGELLQEWALDLYPSDLV